MSLSWIAALRSLGGGGLLGGGAVGLLYVLDPSLFPGAASVQVIAGVGGVLGAGLHYYVSTAVDWILFRPLIKFTRVYGRILMGLPLFPFLTAEQRARILEASVDELVLRAPDRQTLALPGRRRKK